MLVNMKLYVDFFCILIFLVSIFVFNFSHHGSYIVTIISKNLI